MKLFSWLLRLYPARFREEYEMPMERQFRDEYREANSGWSRTRLWMRTLWDLTVSVPEQFAAELQLDLKHGLRVYRHRLASTVLAVIGLALAIGVTTGVFSVLNALLLRSLPFSDPGQLTRLWHPPVSALSGRTGFFDWSRQSVYLESVAAVSPSDMNLTGEREAFRVRIAETSANFFRLLGTNPVAGRTFTVEEDIPGHNEVAVISHSLWQQLYGGDPDISGKPLHVNGARMTVIGVAPAGFDFPGRTAVWMPTVFDFEKVPHRGALFIETIGRLKKGVSDRMAQEMYDAEIRRIPEKQRTLSPGEPDAENRPRLESLQDQLAGPVRQATWVLAGMTLLVLLTACGSVAQLLLSRTTERRQELAVRAALGASLGRILQQLATEATFLTMVAASLGILVAHWTTRIASSIAPAQLASQEYTVLDWRVLGFGIALALAMGVLFGVLPAWFVGRLQPSGQETGHRRGTRDVGTKKARAGLVAAQAALTVCLVTSAFALGIAFLKLLAQDLGFRTENVVTLNVSVQGTRRSGPAEWQYYSEALTRLRAVPGVIAAGGVSYLPLANNVYMGGDFKMDSGQTVEAVVTNAVTHDYFRAMGTPFVDGGDFAKNEMRHVEPSVIVNEAFAQSSGLAKATVGRKIIAPWSATPYTIAGVVATTRFTGPASAGGPQIYWPIKEEPPPAVTLVARVTGNPKKYLAQCRDAVRGVDAQVPIYDVKTLEERLDEVMARPKFYTTATLFLAGLAVVLAVVGIYGTAAYSIAQRRNEVGIRIAIGATHQRVRGMMLVESLAPIVIGTMAGCVLSILLGRSLGYLMENAARTVVWASFAGAGLLLLAGAVSALSATTKVLSILPIESLKAE
jgi:putative ABC transport system permease protein